MFSIIIPVYNVAPYLKECLDSVLRQDFENYEVCIVNDGSSDGSGAICDEYKMRYGDNIKLFHQKNQGVSAARNKALEMASGEWIWFVDADDYILPGALRFLQAIICQSHCDTIFFGSKPYNGDKNVEYNTDELNRFLATHVCYLNQKMIFSRDIIENKGLRFTLGMKMDEDLEFQYKYLLHCQLPVSTEYNFYFYRVRKGSASRNKANKTTLRAAVKGNEKLLSNMTIYLKNNPAPENARWIRDRISERLHKYLFLSSRLPDTDWKYVQRTFDDFVCAYSSMGFSNVKNGRFFIARVSVKLYASLYGIFRKYKRFLRK